MSNIKTALRRGIRAAKSAMGPQRYQAAGKVIACPHCGDQLFDAVLPGLLGYVLDCSRCKQRLLFAESPKRVANDSA